MERAIFRAVGAIITRIDGPNQVQVVAQLQAGHKPDLADQARWISVDLTRTPKHAASWSDVAFDDRGVGADGQELPSVMRPLDLNRIGVTSIGRLKDLPNGQFVGGVYMLEADFTKIQATKIDDPTGAFGWCPNDWFVHELISIAYSKDQAANGARAGRRYVGLHGKVVRRGPGSSVVVDITSATKNPRVVVGTWRFDLKDPAECDDTGPVYGTDKLISDTVDEGAMYVELGFAAASAMRGPKIPIGMGGW